MTATTNFTVVARQLRAQALQLVQAHLAARRLDRANRWRRPALLWPLFTKG